jgi:CDP-4-dehydro-6-deoxyglucose reductase
MVATGTGFAPLKSMMLVALEQDAQRPIHLYWGGRHLVDLYQLELAQEWAQLHPHIKFVPVLSQPNHEDAWSGRKGYVQHAVLQDHPDLSSFEVYACGVPSMVDAARHDFETLGGLPTEAFFADAFLSEADRQLHNPTPV